MATLGPFLGWPAVAQPNTSTTPRSAFIARHVITNPARESDEGAAPPLPLPLPFRAGADRPVRKRPGSADEHSLDRNSGPPAVRVGSWVRGECRRAVAASNSCGVVTDFFPSPRPGGNDEPRPDR